MKKNMSNILNFFNKNFYGVLIFSLLLFIYFISIPGIRFLNSYTLTFYSLSYFLDGFIPRAFIGTLFYLLKLNTFKRALIVICSITIIVIIFISTIINKFINTYDKKTSVIISLLFLFNPASITLIYSNLEVGRLDIFTFIYSVICIILLFKDKLLYSIPIISVLGMITHENYMLWLSPLICMILLFKYFDKKNMKYLLIFILNIVVIFSSLFFVLNKSTKYTNAKEFTNVLEERTNIPVSIFAINDYYFMTKERNDETFVFAFSNQDIHDYVIAAVGIIGLVFILWNICFKYIYKSFSRCKKRLFLLTILSCFSSSLLFFKVCDYGRWYLYIINALLILAMYLFLKYTKLINKNKDNIKKFLPYVILFVAIFIVLYQNDQFFLLTYNKVDKIIYIFKNLFNLMI